MYIFTLLTSQLTSTLWWCLITNGRCPKCASGSSYVTECPPGSPPFICGPRVGVLQGKKFWTFLLFLKWQKIQTKIKLKSRIMKYNVPLYSKSFSRKRIFIKCDSCVPTNKEKANGETNLINFVWNLILALVSVLWCVCVYLYSVSDLCHSQEETARILRGIRIYILALPAGILFGA